MRRVSNCEAMIADVHSVVAGSSTFAQFKVQKWRRTASLKLLIAQEPFEDVCVDLLGPVLVSGLGRRYILVIVCQFTMFVRAFPIPPDDAETVLTAICEECVICYGPCDTSVTDNGPQCSYLIFRGGWRMKGIQKLTLTIDHPQTK